MTGSKNNALRRGFWYGLSSPYRLVYGQNRHYQAEQTDLLSVSWQQVGNSLSVAIESERPKDGEVARSKIHAG